MLAEVEIYEFLQRLIHTLFTFQGEKPKGVLLLPKCYLNSNAGPGSEKPSSENTQTPIQLWKTHSIEKHPNHTMWWSFHIQHTTGLTNKQHDNNRTSYIKFFWGANWEHLKA